MLIVTENSNQKCLRTKRSRQRYLIVGGMKEFGKLENQSTYQLTLTPIGRRTDDITALDSASKPVSELNLDVAGT